MIDYAINKEYSKFADTIKSKLSQKLSAHPIVSKYSNEIDTIRKLKSSFEKINTDN